MGLRLANLTMVETNNPARENIIVEGCGDNGNLTDLGIFLSSLLLSISGLLAVLCSSLRKSNCSTIKCCKCMEIERTNLDVD